MCGTAAKLEEMQTTLDEVVGTIHVLEQRKAALLQELEVLDQKLFKVRNSLLNPLMESVIASSASWSSAKPPCCRSWKVLDQKLLKVVV